MNSYSLRAGATEAWRRRQGNTPAGRCVHTFSWHQSLQACACLSHLRLIHCMSCFQTWDAESHIEEAKLRAVEDRARARWRDTHESLPRKEKEPWRMMDATRLRDFISSQKDDEERLAHELRALSEEEERLSNEAKLESSMQIAAAIADSAAPRRASSPSTESGHILDKNVGSSHASRVRIRSATMWARVHVSRRTNTSFERLMHTYTCDARLHASRASHPRACLRRGAILPRSRCFVKSNLDNR